MINLLIVGYHGFGNCGDEAILLAMKNNIQKLNKDVKITALSYKPEETKALYHIEAVQRFNIRHIFSSVRKSDIVISGGGTLLQDETSTRSLLYYLGIIWLSKLLRKKVMLYSNGIGPVKRKFNRWLIKTVVNKVDLITLRDSLSEQELRQLGVKKPPVYTTADPAFSLEPAPDATAKMLLEKEGVPLDKPLWGVSLRDWKEDNSFVETVARFCDRIQSEYDINILLIPMQYPRDLDISYRLMEKMQQKPYILEEKYKAEETLSIMGQMTGVVSMRLHTLIFAASKRVPLLGLVYDPKVRYYLKILNMPEAGDINEGIDLETMVNAYRDMVENYDAYKHILDEKVTALEEKVLLNDSYLLNLLEELQNKKA